VINASAPPNPWIGWGNVPNVQDACWGKSLTVPWAAAQNMPDTSNESTPSSPATESGTNLDTDNSEEVCMTEYYAHTDWGASSSPLTEDVVTVEVLEVAPEDEDECDSGPETPGPGTPPLERGPLVALPRKHARDALPEFREAIRRRTASV
jgi:hypothetical protein